MSKRLKKCCNSIGFCYHFVAAISRVWEKIAVAIADSHSEWSFSVQREKQNGSVSLKKKRLVIYFSSRGSDAAVKRSSSGVEPEPLQTGSPSLPDPGGPVHPRWREPQDRHPHLPPVGIAPVHSPSLEETWAWNESWILIIFYIIYLPHKWKRTWKWYQVTSRSIGCCTHLIKRQEKHRVHFHLV